MLFSKILQFLLESGVDLIRCKAHKNLHAKLLFECFLPRLGREPAHDLFFCLRNTPIVNQLFPLWKQLSS